MSTEAKCNCQFCNGHIAFPAEMAGQMSACPHCGLETKLFVPNVTKAPAYSPPKNVSIEIKRGVSPLGIGSLVLGIIACVVCWIPFLGLFAIPIALIGIILAFVGVVMAGINRKTGLVFPISGGIVCILSVCIALVATGGFAKLISTAMDENKKTNQTSDAPTIDSSKVEWSNSQSVRQGDVGVTVVNNYVRSVTVNDPTDIYGEQHFTRDKFLVVYVSITNFSSGKKIELETWRNTASLSDNNNNNYQLSRITPVTSVTFGMRCPDPLRNEVARLLTQSELKHIRRFDIRMHRETFDLERHEL